jgi:hypothetical protein
MTLYDDNAPVDESKHSRMCAGTSVCQFAQSSKVALTLTHFLAGAVNPAAPVAKPLFSYRPVA